MDTEDEYINRIQALCSGEHVTAQVLRPTAQILTLTDQSVADHSNSARLWCMRGDLIQLGDDDTGHTLTDALDSYHKAIAADPASSEAHESIGFFQDAIQDDPAAAEPFFRRAIELGAGPPSYEGLARVLAQLGRLEEALQVLAPGACPFWDELDIRLAKSEIEDGDWTP